MSKVYEIEITAEVKCSITKSYPIEADTEEEAKVKAKEWLLDDLEKDNNMISINAIEYGYTGVLWENKK